MILHNYVFSLHWGALTSKTEIQTGNPQLQTDIFQSLQTDESYTDILSCWWTSLALQAHKTKFFVVYKMQCSEAFHAKISIALGN